MAVQARQHNDSGKPIQLVYMRTAQFVYPDFQVYTALSIMSMFVDVIKSAVAAVVKDGGFQLASVPVSTTTAFNTATQLVEWMSKTRNQEELDVFAVKVTSLYYLCLYVRVVAFPGPAQISVACSTEFSVCAGGKPGNEGYGTSVFPFCPICARCNISTLVYKASVLPTANAECSSRYFFFWAQFSRELARLYEYSYLGPVLIMNIHILFHCFLFSS